MRYATLLKWPSLMLLSMAASMLLSGCIGRTRHVIQGAGRTGVSLGNGEYAMSDKDGGMAVGALETKHPPAGTLILVPQTRKEVLDALRAAGVKLGEPEK